MNITESNESSQGSGESSLSVEQPSTIDVLVQGRSDQETAEAVGVARETVTRWRNTNTHFAAQLNRQRRLIWGNPHDRLRALASQTVDSLDAALQNGDARAAVEMFNAVGLSGQLPPPSGPEDAELMLWEAAKAWAELEFKKQRPSIDPTMEFALGEIEIPVLAMERIEELREQYQ